jgi:hypothetical protein
MNNTKASDDNAGSKNRQDQDAVVLVQFHAPEHANRYPNQENIAYNVGYQ